MSNSDILILNHITGQNSRSSTKTPTILDVSEGSQPLCFFVLFVSCFLPLCNYWLHNLSAPTISMKPHTGGNSCPPSGLCVFLYYLETITQSASPPAVHTDVSLTELQPLSLTHKHVFVSGWLFWSLSITDVFKACPHWSILLFFDSQKANRYRNIFLNSSSFFSPFIYMNAYVCVTHHWPHTTYVCLAWLLISTCTRGRCWLHYCFFSGLASVFCDDDEALG